MFATPSLRFSVVTTCGVLLVAGLSARQGDTVVPVHEEPRHRLVYDSPGTKILDVQVPPGDTTLFHTHSDPILYVPMSAARTRSQTLGGEWSGGNAPAAPMNRTAPVADAPVNRTAPVADAPVNRTAPVADAPVNRTAPIAPIAPIAPDAPRRPVYSVTSYAKQPLTHRVNNYGETLFRLIGITNSAPADSSTAPSGDFTSTPEVDNPWFRAHRLTVTTEPSAEHRHTNPVAIIVTNGQASITGFTLVPLPPRGAYVFLEANAPHRIRAISGPAEIVEVEVRRPR